METIVFDVPATEDGALTILEQYYNKAIQETDNKWIFVVSTPELPETDNIKVLNYPWIKKSWAHRLYFDKFVANRIIKQYKPDEVLSLQNVIIPKTGLRQILYLHQILPFVEKRYKITENFKLWVYQNIISKMIYKSIENADQIIVQTSWMKEACLKKVKTDPEKFVVKQPEVNIEVKQYYDQDNSDIAQFFYPVSGFEYKNHKLIVNAVEEIKKQGIHNFRVVFTLNGDENKKISKLFRTVKTHNYPIEFVGKISIEEVYDYYSKSILVFPSYIESFGLPLLEAKMHMSPILASNCAFSHEILDDYVNVEYFDPFNHRELSRLIENAISNYNIKTNKETHV